jgi:hypothetical protein
MDAKALLDTIQLHDYLRYCGLGSLDGGTIPFSRM